MPDDIGLFFFLNELETIDRSTRRFVDRRSFWNIQGCPQFPLLAWQGNQDIFGQRALDMSPYNIVPDKTRLSCCQVIHRTYSTQKGV